jgi:CMP-2-keto-3-deoxyoctulosonic acid synthetase
MADGLHGKAVGSLSDYSCPWRIQRNSGKNIKNFAGFPLIAYSIAAAKQSKYVTRTMSHTDDEKIACSSSGMGR